MQQCLAHGLLAILAAGRPQTLQVMPPLVISDAELDELLVRLGTAVAAMTGERHHPALASRGR
jgi:4-aminobutyrate aminotransferase-like enzyme